MQHAEAEGPKRFLLPPPAPPLSCASFFSSSSIPGTQPAGFSAFCSPRAAGDGCYRNCSSPSWAEPMDSSFQWQDYTENIWPRTWRQTELWRQFFCDRVWQRQFYHLNLNGNLAWAQAGLDHRVVNWKLKKHLQQLCSIDREIKLQSGEVTCSRSHS